MFKHVQADICVRQILSFICPIHLKLTWNPFVFGCRHHNFVIAVIVFSTH